MKTTNEQTIKAAATLLFIVQAEESLSAEYVSLQSIVVDGLKGINDRRKENRLAADNLFKAMNNPVEAVTLANGMLPVRESKDAAERKRAQKRRDWLKARLTAAYSSYDFTTSYSHIVCEYVGDASAREAGQLMASVNRLRDLGIKVEDTTAENLADTIRAEQSNAAGGRIVHTDPAILATKQAILAKFAASLGMQVQPAEGKAIVEQVQVVSN